MADETTNVDVTETNSNEVATDATSDASSKSSKLPAPSQIVPVRGKPVSGRNWKTPKQRFSSISELPHMKLSWEKKQQKREKENMLKQRMREMKEQQEKERQAQLERIKKNRERREQNILKSSSYQVVSTAKVKKMKKSQLKNFVKLADINKR